MKINIENQKLPPIYKRNGKDCYLDPIREKLIYITPEETVRQYIISYLINELNVPKNMIKVEEHLSHYGIDTKRRADIVIEKYNEKNNELNPIAIIECKAPNVYIGEKEQNQAFDYADMMGCNFAMITDGTNCFCYVYDTDNNHYKLIEKLPNYISMIKEDYKEYKIGNIPKRIAFNDIPKYADCYIGIDIGENTPKEKQYAMVNFLEGLLDVGKKLEEKEYELFNLIEDYGIRLLSYGNYGGGRFCGPYRSFLVEYNGNTEFVSIGVSTYISNSRPDIVKTVINVAIDDEKKSHHSLQLVVDDNVKIINNRFYFYHNGRIGISNIGSGKVSELKAFVDELYPKILIDDELYLGSLEHNRLWDMEDTAFSKLIVNLISYALIRDEYRKYKINSKIEDWLWI